MTQDDQAGSNAGLPVTVVVARHLPLAAKRNSMRGRTGSSRPPRPSPDISGGRSTVRLLLTVTTS
jgi:hypothetical protein